MSPSLATEKGLPTNLDAERFVLGSIMIDETVYIQAAGILEPDDFSLEKHRRIFVRMGDLHARGEKIDRVTVANELLRHGELESCDGISYLVSLDDGMPHIYNLESYFRIVKDKSVLRKIIFTSQQPDQPGDGRPRRTRTRSWPIAEETLLKLGESRVKTGLVTPQQVICGYEGGVNAFLDPSRRVKGISTGFTKFDEMTGGLHPGELVILAARPSMGKTALALNMAHHVATRLHKTVAVFSLEMSKESLLTRLFCAAARVDSRRFRIGYLQQDERNRLAHALSELVEAPLHMDDTAGAHLMEMHAKLRRVKAEPGWTWWWWIICS